MEKILIVLAMTLGSQLLAQEAPKSILEFTQLGVPSEVEIPITKDTLVYVFAAVSVLNLQVEPNRVDNDPEGVFSFYDLGNFIIMEVKRNDGTVRFSVIRK
jgi:hypothetical protein